MLISYYRPRYYSPQIRFFISHDPFQRVEIFSDQLGYDGVGRMITKRYLTGGINGTTCANYHLMGPMVG